MNISVLHSDLHDAVLFSFYQISVCSAGSPAEPLNCIPQQSGQADEGTLVNGDGNRLCSAADLVVPDMQ